MRLCITGIFIAVEKVKSSYNFQVTDGKATLLEGER